MNKKSQHFPILEYFKKDLKKSFTNDLKMKFIYKYLNKEEVMKMEKQIKNFFEDFFKEGYQKLTYIIPKKEKIEDKVKEIKRIINPSKELIK